MRVQICNGVDWVSSSSSFGRGWREEENNNKWTEKKVAWNKIWISPIQIFQYCSRPPGVFRSTKSNWPPWCSPPLNQFYDVSKYRNRISVNISNFFVEKKQMDFPSSLLFGKHIDLRGNFLSDPFARLMESVILYVSLGCIQDPLAIKRF